MNKNRFCLKVAMLSVKWLDSGSEFQAYGPVNEKA